MKKIASMTAWLFGQDQKELFQLLAESLKKNISKILKS